MKEDKRIWEDFKKGDENALSWIYYQNVSSLFQYGMKLSKKRELVKDTIQDLFFDLLSTRYKLGPTENIRLYLIKSFRHRLFRNLKKLNKYSHNVEESEILAELADSVEDVIISNEEIMRKETLFQQGLKALAPRQREILFYRFTCNLKYDQICDIMALRYDSARKQVFRAIKALKEKLNERIRY